MRVLSRVADLHALLNLVAEHSMTDKRTDELLGAVRKRNNALLG